MPEAKLRIKIRGFALSERGRHANYRQEAEVECENARRACQVEALPADRQIVWL